LNRSSRIYVRVLAVNAGPPRPLQTKTGHTGDGPTISDGFRRNVPFRG
jgi:hypothetical protein